MPEMDGYEVCEKLKADERTRDIPVIFISALENVLDKVKGFSVGEVHYITKPFQEEEVLIRVKTHLSLRGMQKLLEAQNKQLQREIALREQAEKKRRDYQLRLQQARKTESLGRMAGAMAHKFNNHRRWRGLSGPVEGLSRFPRNRARARPSGSCFRSWKNRHPVGKRLESGEDSLQDGKQEKYMKSLFKIFFKEYQVDELIEWLEGEMRS